MSGFSGTVEQFTTVSGDPPSLTLHFRRKFFGKTSIHQNDIRGFTVVNLSRGINKDLVADGGIE